MFARIKEAVTQRCSVKKASLEISQNSQENTCVRVSFLIKLQACNFIKKETLAQVCFCEFWEISKNTFFYRTPLVDATGIIAWKDLFMLHYVKKIQITLLVLISLTNNLWICHCMKSVQIRSFLWSIFSPNAGKYGPEKTPYLDNFNAVCQSSCVTETGIYIKWLWRLWRNVFKNHNQMLKLQSF